eukprot:scaffold90_cov264-Pinguiococcus_pyrenoidosus.AAC.18
MLLSIDCPTQKDPLGWRQVEWMACMLGSLMYFIGTGRPHSHTRIFLSSDVLMKRLFPST